MAKQREAVVTNIFTADPSAHVFNDKIYVYPSHDLPHDGADEPCKHGIRAARYFGRIGKPVEPGQDRHAAEQEHDDYVFCDPFEILTPDPAPR